MKLDLKEWINKVSNRAIGVQTFTGTNCSAMYIHIGNIVIAHLTQTISSANYTGLPKPIQTRPYMYGLGCIFRATNVGGYAVGEGYTGASGGITMNVSGFTSGNTYATTIAYLTDEVGGYCVVFSRLSAIGKAVA